MTKRIPQSFIDEVLSRIDIVDIIQARIQLKKTGQNHQAKCPFHTEKTASFTVSQPKQFYYCFGCQASGNAISFLMQYDRLEFLDALKMLASQAGLDIPETLDDTQTQQFQPLYTVLEKTAQFYQQHLRTEKTAIEYLKSRGLTGEIAKQFHIGFAPNNWDELIRHVNQQHDQSKILLTAGLVIKNAKGGFYDRFRHRIMFPIRDLRGRTIGFGGRTMGDEQPKYLNSPETPVFHKGKELYGLYEARQANRKLEKVLIVEGYMDVIALAQYGFPFAVATLGTATSQQQLHTLFRYTNTVIFCFDGDNAGRKAAWRALEITLPIMRDGLTVKFLFLPEGEDPDSCVRKSTEAFQTHLDNALPLSEFFFQQLNNQVGSDSVDDKAKVATLANQLLATMSDGVFKTLLLEQLAERLTLDPAKLSDLLNKPTQPEALPIKTKKPSRHAIKRTPVRLAIALLLQNPKLADTISETANLTGCQYAGVPTLHRILETIKAQSNSTTGTLLEHWRDSKQAKTLAELAAWDHLIPEEGQAHELQGAINLILAQIRDDTIQGLLKKAKQNTLSTEERQQLKQLLANKNEPEVI